VKFDSQDQKAIGQTYKYIVESEVKQFKYDEQLNIWIGILSNLCGM